MVFSFLTPFELTHFVNLACKLFFTITNAGELWRQFTLNRFDVLSFNANYQPLVPSSNSSWKSIYKAFIADMPIDENQFYNSNKDVEGNIKCPFCCKTLVRYCFTSNNYLLD